MKTRRDKVFETNSSSVNTFVLAESSKSKYDIPDKLTTLDFSWDGRTFHYDDVDGKFTCLLKACDTAEEVFGLCYKLYAMGVKEIVFPHPDHYDAPYSDGTLYISTGEIYDSEEELKDVMKSEDKIKRWLFDPVSFISGEDDN